MPLTTVYCGLHLGNVSLNEVKVLKCGHGFCITCLSGMQAAARERRQDACPTCRTTFKFTDARPIYIDPARGSSRSPSPQIQHSPTHNSSTNDEREKARLQDENLQLRARLLEAEDDVQTIRVAAENRQLDLEQRMNRIEAADIRYTTQFFKLQADVTALRIENARLRPVEEELAKTRAEVTRTKGEKATLLHEISDINEREKRCRELLIKQKNESTRLKGKVKWLKQQVEMMEEEKEKSKVGTQHTGDESLLVLEPVFDGIFDQHKEGSNENWLDELWMDERPNDLDHIDADDDSLTEAESVIDNDDVPRPLPSFSRQKAGQKHDRPLPNDRPRSFARFPSDWILSNPQDSGKGIAMNSAATASGSGKAMDQSVSTLKKRKRGDGEMGRDVILGSGSRSNIGSTIVRVTLDGSKGKGKGKEKQTRADSRQQSSLVSIVTREDRIGATSLKDPLGGSKAKAQSRTERKPNGSKIGGRPAALNFDSQGRVKGLVACGSRQSMVGAMKF